MSQKSSVPQPLIFVSRVLTPDNRYGGPDDGFSGSSDFFGQTLGGVASVATGLATPGLGYGYGNSPYYGSGYRYNSYGMSSYGYARPYYVGTSGTLYPVVTGRSAAIDGFGKYCATPIKTCLLYEPSVLGNGCSLYVVR